MHYTSRRVNKKICYLTLCQCNLFYRSTSIVCYNVDNMKAKQRSAKDVFVSYLSSDSQDQETKFDLYVQSRKVKQISLALDRFAQASSEGHSWLSDDHELVGQLVDELLDDSLLALDGIQLDPEGVELSVDLISEVRKALSMVEQIAGGDMSDEN